MGYHLLIVDDETLTRESLLQYVNWRSLGIEKASTAESGAAALLLMESQDVDILLTDVRMPKMDGIALATEVRRLHPACHIVFLSGYADKEYLKAAISLKSDGYIEKPVAMEEMTSVMQSVTRQLDAKRHSHESEELLVMGLVNSLALVQQEVALALISPQADYDTIYAQYAPLYFAWAQRGLFSVLYLEPDNPLTVLQKGTTLLQTLTDYFSSSSFPIPADFFAAHGPEEGVILLINGMNKSQLLQSAALLQRHVWEELCVNITVGVSNSYARIEHLAAAYSEAQAAAAFRFYRGGWEILYTQDISYNTTDVSGLFHLPTVDLASVSELFDKLEEARCADIFSVKQSIYKLYCSMLERTLNGKGLTRDDFFPKTLTEMRELVLYGLQALHTMGDDIYDRKIKNAIHYMLWNYANPQLSVKLLAEHVGLSQNYFCALFKQTTQSTVNDFLIRIRIDKTQKLLRSTDLRLYEITEKVGLTDPNYLSALFKRITGQTPSQYRISMQRNGGVQ